MSDPSPIKDQASEPAWDPELLARAETLEWQSRVLVAGFLQGMHRSRLRGFSSEFAQYAPYMQGDDLRYVDWRAYGRLDRLYLRQFESETNLRCQIFMDASHSMAYGSSRSRFTKHTFASLLAASLMRLFYTQNDAFGLSIGREELIEHLKPRVTRAHFFHCLSVLEKIRPQGTCQMDACLHSMSELTHRRGLAILLTDGWSNIDETLKGLQRLRYDHHDVCLVQVVDPQELEFQFTESDLFEDMETGLRLPVTPDWNRKHYLKALQEHQALLKKHCLDLGIHHFIARTDRDPFQVLAGLVNQREAAL